MARALESGLHTQRFFVAGESRGPVAGAMAVADCHQRSISTDPKSYRRHFGLIAARVLKEEFELPLSCPPEVGYITSVCVLKEFQGQGIAKRMLQHAMEHSPYQRYELDVTNVNNRAIRCYEACGFKEYKREKVKHAAQKGFQNIPMNSNPPGPGPGGLLLIISRSCPNPPEWNGPPAGNR